MKLSEIRLPKFKNPKLPIGIAVVLGVVLIVGIAFVNGKFGIFASGTGTPLVTDGSFELGMDGWIAHNSVAAQSTEQAHDGTHSIKITNTADYGSVRHSYTTAIGQRYQVSAWVYNSNTNTRLWVGSVINMGDLSRTSPGLSTGWVQISNYFVATGTTTYFEFRPAGTSIARSYLDQFSLTAVAAPTITATLTINATATADAANSQKINFDAKVLNDSTPTDVTGTTYTFWWNCTGILPTPDQVNYASLATACGGDTSSVSNGVMTNNANDSIGRQFPDLFKTSLADGSEKSTNYTYATAGQKIVVVLVKRARRIPAYQSIPITVTSSVLASVTPVPSAISSATHPSVTPTPHAQETNFTFPKGFTAFGNTKTVSTDLFTSQGLYVYQFDGANNKWLVTGTDNFNVQVWKGYYIYNPSTTAKTVSVPYDLAIANMYAVTKGWNLLYSVNTKPSSDLQLELNSTTSGLAQTYIDQGLVNSRVFIIDNDRATDSCSYFKLWTNADSDANCSVSPQVLGTVSQIPAGKDFWVYVK